MSNMNEADDLRIPGAPAPEAPSVDEPTSPREPLPSAPDQRGPERRTPTGAPTDVPAEAVAQQGAYMTTAQGARLPDTDHSLKAGPRGPVLLQDHHLREKIMHFDHERIPERAVHARGAAAHGFFEANGAAETVTKAAFLRAGKRTRVFVRFSTVLGSRGSADTALDTRGFATKFYTDEGVYDLVGNNIPVFFIQDAIKFPDVIHAGKPHPDREIPQAQSAHDTFWDFVSLHTEAQHHTIWNMSDRALPRSFRMMQGFGVHTFRLENASGETSLVKFHWRPKLETEQVAFHPGHLVPGIDVTNDPLLQGRLFSYLDTQLTRLGGPNFAQLPINRPHADVNDMLRDGMHHTAVHAGVAPYHPNSLDGGCPFHAGADAGGYVEVPAVVAESVKERRQPASFDDHFSQASLFYRSLTAVEQQHIAAAYAFELGKCYEKAIKERQLAALANVDAGLCAEVSAALGLPAPERTVDAADTEPSPALRMVGGEWPIDGRVVGVLADDATDAGDLTAVRTALASASVVPLVIAPHGGTLGVVPIQRSFDTATSVEFDAVVVLARSEDRRARQLLEEAYRHGKAVGLADTAAAVADDLGVTGSEPGVVTGDATTVADGVLASLPAHRVWDRLTA